MKLNITCCLLFISQSATLLGQKPTEFTIQKTIGSYTKTLKLPINLRILKNNEQIVLLRLDSIKNEYWYGNKGTDSVHLSEINTINLRGAKEIIKFTSLTVCAASALAATAFTIYAFNNPVVIDGDNNGYKYVGMGYAATFATIGTALYFYPRTRFNTTKYKFHTH